jgi:hypothetical protein
MIFQLNKWATFNVVMISHLIFVGYDDRIAREWELCLILNICEGYSETNLWWAVNKTSNEKKKINILSWLMGACDYRRVWIGEWIYWPLVYNTRNYTLQITDTHSVPILLQSPLDVSWQRLPPRVILQLPTLRSSCHSHLCRTLCHLGPMLAAISHLPHGLLFTGSLSTDN